MQEGYSIFVEKKSFLHDTLDPRTKFVGLICIFALSLLFNHPLPLAILLASVICVGWFSQLGWRTLMPFLYASLWFLILGILIWPFYITQGKMLFTVLHSPITVDGLLFGVAMGLRVALMVTTAAICMLSTSPQKIMLGLLKMKIPYKAGMAFSMTIRFIPLINAERLTITEAKRTRGLNLDEGNAFKKAIKYAGIIGPLMLRIFDLINTLAVAMDCRGFGARDGRTSIISIAITKTDKTVMAVCFALVLVGVACRTLGIGILVKYYL